jgi:hypothetical protein
VRKEQCAFALAISHDHDKIFERGDNVIITLKSTLPVDHRGFMNRASKMESQQFLHLRRSQVATSSTYFSGDVVVG